MISRREICFSPTAIGQSALQIKHVQCNPESPERPVFRNPSWKNQHYHTLNENGSEGGDSVQEV